MLKVSHISKISEVATISIDELVPSEPSVVYTSYLPLYNKLKKGETLPYVKVVLIDDEYIIVDGNNRAKAAKDFGYTSIPVDVVTLPKNRELFFRKSLDKFRHLKGLADLPIYKNRTDRRERYSNIKFAHYSKNDIEQLIPEDNSILISITGTASDFANVDDSLYKDILRIRFSDIQKDFGKFRAFTKNQAKDILSFVDSNLPISYVYINCERGQSRSAACHSALEKIYNDKFVDFPKSNIHVKNILLSLVKE